MIFFCRHVSLDISPSKLCPQRMTDREMGFRLFLLGIACVALGGGLTEIHPAFCAIAVGGAVLVIIGLGVLCSPDARVNPT